MSRMIRLKRSEDVVERLKHPGFTIMDSRDVSMDTHLMVDLVVGVAVPFKQFGKKSPPHQPMVHEKWLESLVIITDPEARQLFLQEVTGRRVSRYGTPKD